MLMDWLGREQEPVKTADYASEMEVLINMSGVQFQQDNQEIRMAVRSKLPLLNPQVIEEEKSLTLKQQIALLQNILERKPQEVETRLALARLWIQARLAHRAIKECSQILETNPTYVDAYLLRAKLHADSGD